MAQIPSITNSPSQSRALTQWVADASRLTEPGQIVWCNGSEAEKRRLTQQAVKAGVLIELDRKKRPGCYLHRSNPNDVARTEQLTFVCTESEDDAGATNNWAPPDETYAKIRGWLKGSMRGRTMYVVPYVMGPIGSRLSKVGVEITDSIYVALSMGIMTRMGTRALKMLGDSDDFNRGLHCTLDLNPERRLICHFPQDNTIWSVGSGYGGNALLSKKCFALRIASWLGRSEGWLAEHMLILGIQSPDGETTYVVAAFPSACGKTNLAMLTPPPALAAKGWKVFTVGDDIAWLRVGADGRLWAVNPEAGYFGVAPGTSERSNLNAMRMLEHDSFFTNVAMTPDGDVWWEGMDGEPPPGLIDWKGNLWDGPCEAAHPNSRFTTPMTNNPALSPHADDPEGVPISAIIFGGRRATTMPLVLESSDWTHGVFRGATMGSETTAAAAGAVGVVRRDPMAMLPFCGYNMGDYFAHWLRMRNAISRPPKIFMVNWFRKDAHDKFIWPGYGENLRVLKWMLDRTHGRVHVRETPVGGVPDEKDIDLTGLDLAPESLRQALAINAGEWRAEMESVSQLFDKIGTKTPAALLACHRELTARLESPPARYTGAAR
ncbi:MAG: phosphoenolpyruvate carboxykinase (GTP) [Candidatus Binataceae bacterium]